MRDIRNNVSPKFTKLCSGRQQGVPSRSTKYGRRNQRRDGHLNATSRKSLEIPLSSMSKRRTLSNRNFYKLRCLPAVLTHESRIAEELVVSLNFGVVI